ncbi:hypothetical protein LP420_18020 [Massilia sp. B-10]|nr:hypothetical protein LP420_18020 [Massilia sp. B-10]
MEALSEAPLAKGYFNRSSGYYVSSRPSPTSCATPSSRNGPWFPTSTSSTTWA